MQDGYLIPVKMHRVETVVKKSRFIATLAHAPDAAAAKDFVFQVRKEFNGANHNCWAYVAGRAGDGDHAGMSDDGEPHGTAGRPMLGVLLHSGIGEVVAVVTRYFGGIKLGTGGLVKAYAGTVKSALATLPTREKIEMARLLVVADYAHDDSIKRVAAEFEALLISVEYGGRIRYVMKVNAAVLERFAAAIQEVTNGRAKIEGIRDEE